MKPFMDAEFLLSTPTAQRLYHTHAEGLPIVDYHCHVPPREIYEDRAYDNPAQVWLGGGGYGDHYKWRLMRACGEPERLITGDAPDYERFLAFARTLPKAPGNPVYHWTHLELRRFFGCDLPLNEDTAAEIWAHCTAQLRGGLTVRRMILRSNVVGLATTDDPLDSLEWHAKLAADDSFPVVVKPAWRPDKLMNPQMAGFGDSLAALGGVADWGGLCDGILGRMDHFAAHGCTASDHGIEFLEYVPATASELTAILQKGAAGGALTRDEIAAWQFALLRFLGGEYARRGWVMELHFGAVRNINTAQFDALGADTGYDAIAPVISVPGLPALLDALSSDGALPKTVLFSLSPADNAMLNTIAGGFQAEGVRGRVQQGAAWWFNDTKQGMIDQMVSMASLAPLGNFLGMVTDSRSFLSYTRHEYFRRILCDLLGKWVENGEYPDDDAALGRLIRDISFYNAKEYFGF